jgi:uncharacterized protein YggE
MRGRFIPRSIVVTLLGLALMGTPFVAAQGGSSILPGITVTGHGEATAPADTATLNIIVSEANYGPPVVPQPGVVPGERERTAVAPIVASLVDGGIAEDQIDVIVGASVVDFGTYAGPAMAIIRFTVDSPTLEQITGLVDGATAAAADERLLIGRTSAVYGVADCATLETQARELAVADARDRAEAMAGFLDVSLGDIIASHDVAPETQAGFGPYGPVVPMNTCTSTDAATSLFGAISLPPFDPTAEVEVSAYAEIELTFEMSFDFGATPST